MSTNNSNSLLSLPPSPLLSTRRVRLRPLADTDGAFLYQLMVTPQAGGRVRFAGATPSPEKIAASLWDSVLAQFIIESAGERRPLGLVAITTPNFRDGFAYISALGAPEVQGKGLIAQGVMLCFHYAFTTWPFRKIYMESSDESYRAFESGLGRYFTEEGRLREHVFWNGSFMDIRILAVYRETWQRLAPMMLMRMRAKA